MNKRERVLKAGTGSLFKIILYVLKSGLNYERRFYMKELKGTKTEANLKAAFAGESEARNKYTYYASKAKKEGYEQIADLVQTAA